MRSLAEKKQSYSVEFISPDKKIRKLNGYNCAAKKISHILLHSKREIALYQKICDCLIKLNGNDFIWIGLNNGMDETVNCVAHAGKNKYSCLLKFARNEVADLKKIVFINDIGRENASLNLGKIKTDALKNGFKSLALVPLIYNRKTIGCLNLFSEKINSFSIEDIRFLTETAGNISAGIGRLKTEKELEKNLMNTRRMLYEIIDSIAFIIERRDPYTSRHQKRVAMLAAAIAKEMKFDESIVEGIYFTAILHDIGKIIIPLSILSKPSDLTRTEVLLIQGHSEEGYNFLKNIEFPWPVAQAILQHHERINGSGYPNKLKGNEIITEAKIIAVADVIEAMSAHRPYRPAIGLGKALREIESKQNKLYDADIVQVCIELFKTKKFSFSA